MTGPDEYSAVADNNVYTNLMAQRNLVAAADAVTRCPQEAAALRAGEEEAASWRDAVSIISMYFCFGSPRSPMRMSVCANP